MSSTVSRREWRHPLMRHTDSIKVIGVNGDECTLSGPGMGDWGPILAPHSTGLLASAPFKTNWAKSMLGQKFSSWIPQRRDVAWTVHILNPHTGQPDLDRDPDTWHMIYSRWRAMFHPDHEATVVYTSVDGERRLGMREIKEPQPFVGAEFEGRDPHLTCYGSIGMLMGCENPYFIGPTERYEWETGQQGDFWFSLPYYNPASAMIWPKWYLSHLATWTVPDYSFGWEEHGTGVADLGKTVELPELFEGEHVEADSRPDVMTLVAANGNPVQQRLNGRDLEYPIQPGAGDPENGCTVSVRNVTNPDGARCELEMPRWYNEPFSLPTVVGAAVGVGAG
jgi:hypothetical protein